MKEVYGRECELHLNSCMLAKKVQQIGYWFAMEANYYAYVRRCHKC